MPLQSEWISGPQCPIYEPIFGGAPGNQTPLGCRSRRPLGNLRAPTKPTKGRETAAKHLEEARRVRAVKSHDGQDFVFVDGETAGVPMSEVIVEGKSQPGAGEQIRPILPLDEGQGELSAKGLRKAVFNLDEGDVTVTYPEDMSADGCRDLDAYLKVFMRKAKRRAYAWSSPVEGAEKRKVYAVRTLPRSPGLPE